MVVVLYRGWLYSCGMFDRASLFLVPYETEKYLRHTGRKPASYSGMYDRNNNIWMLGAYTTAADIVSVP